MKKAILAALLLLYALPALAQRPECPCVYQARDMVGAALEADTGLTLSWEWSLTGPAVPVVTGELSSDLTVIDFGAAGDFVLSVTVTDGRVTLTSPTFSINVDEYLAPAPPVITGPGEVERVADAAFVTGPEVILQATATDNVGVAGVWFLIDGDPTGLEVLAPDLGTVDRFTHSWDSTTTTNGLAWVSARARDASGNEATAEWVPVFVANPAP